MEVLLRRFESDLDEVHVRRVRVLFEAAFTALRSGGVALTSLGRAIAERTTPKQGIKRIDRLLRNTCSTTITPPHRKPGFEAKTLFEVLCEEHPGRYNPASCALCSGGFGSGAPSAAPSAT